MIDPFPGFVPFSRRSDTLAACGPVREIVAHGKVLDRARYNHLAPPEPLLSREPEPIGSHKVKITAPRRTPPGQNVVQRWAKYQERGGQ